MRLISRPGPDPLRRSRLYRRVLYTLLVLFLIWTAAEITAVQRRLDPLVSVDERILRKSHLRTERVFIVGIHWNNEWILRNYWNQAVTDLAQTLGPENVFLSIYESGSYDNTKGALVELDRMLDPLGVPRNITLSEVTHQDEIVQPSTDDGWLQTEQTGKELRRIPYLSRLRNLSLQPLVDLAKQGIHFDRVLFLNDVVFTTQDVLELLQTKDGRYAAACALDFSHPPAYYDTFALRDIQGHEPIMQTWPYFGSSASRQALKRMEPIPVASCWNGIVAMRASPFVARENPLRFRGIHDSLAREHLEGSECCLIHADNPLSSLSGVYLNPRVRVGYHGAAYDAVHPGEQWLTSWKIWAGLWSNRLRRWGSVNRSRRETQKRVVSWEREHGQEERGAFCLIDEMQVLRPWGWAHV
ncbi:hypothetical protein P170DRAFT_371759 [Aspergillus steynii IBT 23096]|uniref:Polysaccharide export protein n=1 Tax=Aspergillus steynii IBT 23096 TaxID=1392250 RepID=A0A2I2GL82_9EURO|nr:uncharacterized protein P170DRAFT_371759 [Aspergillus steynii IBT 23096]PLB53630.1 hypothetical protein P170DRAFT_371759 [Aspergillus steynii IBT 23096]